MRPKYANWGRCFFFNVDNSFLFFYAIFRADHNTGGLGTSRWLEALWEPAARLYTLPNALDMLHVSGDGDARLVCADLGTFYVNSPKVIK